MKKYKLYEHKDGRKVITCNDIVEFKYLDHKYSGQYKKAWEHNVGVSMEFMAGDIALDNGFEFKREVTEEEIFVEFL